jgi:hypothetical protein
MTKYGITIRYWYKFDCYDGPVYYVSDRLDYRLSLIED